MTNTGILSLQLLPLNAPSDVASTVEVALNGSRVSITYMGNRIPDLNVDELNSALSTLRAGQRGIIRWGLDK